MANILYDRERALYYAQTWAFKRNPRFFNFDKLGGDCTNFVSQILLAGGCPMNYNKKTGWYYINSTNRSPSWTSASFLYNFLTKNKILGPFAHEVDINNAEVADIIQLNFEDDFLFDHSLIVSKINYPPSFDNILVSSHTYDRFDNPLSSINFKKVRFLHIGGSYK